MEGQTGGDAVQLRGNLSVEPGDVLQAAVGQKGGDGDGKANPGAGGWSWPDERYKGDRGGSSHGENDAAGGGRATVVLLNNFPWLIAAGGGGSGAPGAFKHGWAGGNGGMGVGADGERFGKNTGGPWWEHQLSLG